MSGEVSARLPEVIVAAFLTLMLAVAARADSQTQDSDSKHLGVKSCSGDNCHGAIKAAEHSAVAVAVTVDTAKPGATIDRNVFGQFSEHLGKGIYGGIWVGERSSIPNVHGYRRDVVDALKKIPCAGAAMARRLLRGPI